MHLDCGLGLGTVDAVDDNLDLELDEILKEYNEAQSQSQENDPVNLTGAEATRNLQDDPLVCSSSTSLPPQTSPSSSLLKIPIPEITSDSKLVDIKGLASFVQELTDELEIILFYHRKCYARFKFLIIHCFLLLYYLNFSNNLLRFVFITDKKFKQFQLHPTSTNVFL